MQNSNVSEVLANLATRWAKSSYDSARAIKMEELFGKWGTAYTFHVGPFLSLIPLLVLVVMGTVFKRRKLLGVTQKFILSIIGMSACCTTTAGVRDVFLWISRRHYGFLEYDVCALVIISFRIQSFCIATAAWLNTLMLLHQVILVGFPLKAKLYNFARVLYVFHFFHATFCVSFLIILNFPSLQSVPLIQKYQPGYPVKKIEGCIVHSSIFLDEYVFYDMSAFIAYSVLIYSKLLPLALHCIIIVTLCLLLLKHIRILSVLMNNVSTERIKYVTLLKVNVGLGVSSIIQELPVFIILIYQVNFNIVHEEDVKDYSPYLGITTTAMSVSYCVGKPVDLLIYASLSKAFKKEIKNLLVCGHKSTDKSRDISQIRVKK